MKVLSKILLSPTIFSGIVVLGISFQAHAAYFAAQDASQYTGISKRNDHVSFDGTGTKYIDFPIWVSAAGNFSLVVEYTSDDHKEIDISVNGSQVKSNVRFPNVGWSNKSQHTISNVYLEKGVQNIRFTAPTAGAPNIYGVDIENTYHVCRYPTSSDWGWENSRSCHKNDTPVVMDCKNQTATSTPIDENALSEVKKLLTNLKRLTQCDRFIFGSEFPLSMIKSESGANNDTTNSDMKDVIDDHAGVHGLDPHYMLYKGTTARTRHINAARAGYNAGSVITLDFHHKGWAPLAEGTKFKDYHDWITDSQGCVKSGECNIVKNQWYMANIIEDLFEGGEHGAKANYEATLQAIVNIINNESKMKFPVALRMLHEMNGDWFWWGTDAAQANKKNGGQYSHSEMYKKLYQHTVKYIRDRTDYAIFIWSPDVAQHHKRDFTEAVDDYWPGDNYVDIVGIDYYEPSIEGIRNQLGQLTDFAKEKDKIAVVAELGHRGGDQKDYREVAPEFWNDTVLEAIKNDPANKAQRIAWLQTWLHQKWSSYYIPVQEDRDTNTDAYKDFRDFSFQPDTLFQWSVHRNNADAAIKLYE